MTDHPPKSSDAAETPEGHTSEQPAASEIGKPGTPGAEDHGHAEAALGPIDWGSWGMAIVGAAAGAIVLACFALVVGI